MGFLNAASTYVNNPTNILKNIKFRVLCKASDSRHIFILGAPRSGTTLLQSIVSANSKITSFDEETGFFMYRDFFSKQFSDVPADRYIEMCKSSSDMVDLFDNLAKLKKDKDKKSYFRENPTARVVFKIPH